MILIVNMNTGILYLFKQFILVSLLFTIGTLISNIIFYSVIEVDLHRWIFTASFLTIFLFSFKFLNYRSHGLAFDNSDLKLSLIPEYQKITISKLKLSDLVNRIKYDYKFSESTVSIQENIIDIDLKEDFWKSEHIEIKQLNTTDKHVTYLIKSTSRHWWLAGGLFLGDFGENKCNVNYLEKLIIA